MENGYDNWTSVLKNLERKSISGQEIGLCRDEVTGTGSLVHRLVFGVTEKEGRGVVLRDWELLKVLNGISSGSGAPPDTVPTMEGAGAEVEHLKQIFDEDISDHAPMP
jgi:hypothetical protein